MTDERNYGRAGGDTSLATEDWRWDEDRLRGLIGYKVIDRDGERIGTLATMWEDAAGEPAFLGVRTGWLGFGKIHVVPANTAEWEASSERIRLPFSVQAVKEAPTFDEDAELDPVTEGRIYTYYQRYGFTLPARASAESGMADGAARGSGADEFPATANADVAPTQAIGGMEQGRKEGTEEKVIPLREEELVVGKRETGGGGVRLRKIVRTEIVDQPVEVVREDVVIERVPASGMAEGAPGDLREEEIFIPLRREEAVVGKRVRTREEVRVRKTATTESKPVSEELRKEDIEVERGEEGQHAAEVDPYRDDRSSGGRDLPM